jgi:superoxide dismutase, Fe-Mn family
MIKYVLPPLPYTIEALEPHISAQVLSLHHGKHHATYVKNANLALEQIEAARDEGDLSKMAALEKSLAFNLSGHILHSLFWRNMKPRGGGLPEDKELAEAIDRDFGSFDRFKLQMKEVASTIMGSGWAALVWEPLGQRLLTTQIYDHQSNLAQGGIPLMVIDAWEHAYYLQYENRKQDFFEAIWNVWNWLDIAERYRAVRSLDLEIPGAVSRRAA